MNKPKLYVPKATSLSAIQWQVSNSSSVRDFTNGRAYPSKDNSELSVVNPSRGVLKAKPNDWIIQIGDESFSVLSQEEFAAKFQGE